MDAQPPQVAIQVLIADVQLTTTEEVGIEFGLQSPVLFNRGGLSSPGSTSTPQPARQRQREPAGYRRLPGLSNLGVGRVGSSGFGGFVFSASSQSFQLLIERWPRKAEWTS